MATQKDRRQNGYITPRATVSKNGLIENDLFITPFYDDWEDYRDGFREWFRDFKKIKKPSKRHSFFNSALYEKRLHMNVEQNKLLSIRKVRKCKN